MSMGVFEVCDKIGLNLATALKGVALSNIVIYFDVKYLSS